MSKRWIVILFAAVAGTAILFQLLPGQAVAAGSWGLSFQKEGSAPKGPLWQVCTVLYVSPRLRSLRNSPLPMPHIWSGPPVAA